MLDNLRDQSSFQEEEPVPVMQAPAQPIRRRKSSARLMGMTAPQRFFLSLMLLIMVCLLGFMALLVTEKIFLPF